MFRIVTVLAYLLIAPAAWAADHYFRNPLPPVQLFTAETAVPAYENMSAPTSISVKARVGASIHHPYPAEDGTTPYFWTVVGGNLPDGTSFSEGVLDGVPLFPGTSSLEIEMHDSASPDLKLQGRLDVDVRDAPRVEGFHSFYAFGNPPTLYIHKGTTSSWRVNQRHIVGDSEWTLDMEIPGISISTESGMSTGSLRIEPTAPIGLHTLVATVTDDWDGSSASGPLRVHVDDLASVSLPASSSRFTVDSLYHHATNITEHDLISAGSHIEYTFASPVRSNSCVVFRTNASANHAHIIRWSVMTEDGEWHDGLNYAFTQNNTSTNTQYGCGIPGMGSARGAPGLRVKKARMLLVSGPDMRLSAAKLGFDGTFPSSR